MGNRQNNPQFKSLIKNLDQNSEYQYDTIMEVKDETARQYQPSQSSHTAAGNNKRNTSSGQQQNRMNNMKSSSTKEVKLMSKLGQSKQQQFLKNAQKGLVVSKTLRNDGRTEQSMSTHAMQRRVMSTQETSNYQSVANMQQSRLSIKSKFDRKAVGMLNNQSSSSIQNYVTNPQQKRPQSSVSRQSNNTYASSQIGVRANQPRLSGLQSNQQAHSGANLVQNLNNDLGASNPYFDSAAFIYGDEKPPKPKKFSQNDEYIKFLEERQKKKDADEEARKKKGQTILGLATVNEEENSLAMAYNKDLERQKNNKGGPKVVSDNVHETYLKQKKLFDQKINEKEKEIAKVDKKN